MNDEVASKPKRGRPGVSREQWLEAALDIFEHRGIEAVRIEPLARQVGVNKSGFYWHFRDRGDLLKALLDFWESLENRPIAVRDGSTEVDPIAALRRIGEDVDREDLAKLDAAIRQWGKTDPDVQNRYQQRVERRFQVIRRLFSELGFTDAELEMRVHLFICYTSNERSFFKDLTAEKRAEMREVRLQMMTGRTLD